MFGLTPYERKRMDVWDAFRDFENSFFPFEKFETPLCAIKTDIKEEGDKFVLEAEMPGFEKEEIKLDVDGKFLTLSAEHKEEKEEKDKHGKYLRRERSYGTYSRSFDITGVNADGIEAEYKNGVLTVALPKKAKEEPAVKRLEIK